MTIQSSEMQDDVYLTQIKGLVKSVYEIQKNIIYPCQDCRIRNNLRNGRCTKILRTVRQTGVKDEDVIKNSPEEDFETVLSSHRRTSSHDTSTRFKRADKHIDKFRFLCDLETLTEIKEDGLKLHGMNLHIAMSDGDP